MLLATVLVVALGLMAVALSSSQPNKQELVSDVQTRKLMEQKSESDEVSHIEEDVMDTDLTNIDSELQDIETELNQGY